MTESEARCGWFHGAASLGSESYDTKRRLLSIRECVERGKYDPMTGGVCVVRGNRTSGRTGTVLLMLSCGVASVGSSCGLRVEPLPVKHCHVTAAA